jgi:Ca2+-dependent lipid-binding protein
MTGGKSDPYVRIMSGVQNRGQTDYIDDDLNPEWNQILYVPVHSIREDLIFEVMDYNENTKDKSLGMAEFVLKDIIKQVKQEGQIIYEALESLDR